MIWNNMFCKKGMFSRVYKSKFKHRFKTVYQFVKSLLVVRIVTNFTGYHVTSAVIFWLLGLLQSCSSRSDLRGHVTDGKMQILPSVSSYWFVGLSYI